MRKENETRKKRALRRVLFALLPAFGLQATLAQSPQQFSVTPGKNVTLFKSINTAGTVYLHISTTEGAAACANLWWITKPWGSKKELGPKCGNVALQIPGLPAAGAELRIGGVSAGTIVRLTTEESVANSKTFEFPES